MAAYLFNRTSIFDIIEHQKQAVLTAVRKYDGNALLTAPPDDLVGELSVQFEMAVPRLRNEEIHIGEHKEFDVDVSGHQDRYIRDRSRPFCIPGTKTTIVVPFDGEGIFFSVQPQTFTLNPPRGEVVGGALHLTYVRTDQDAAALKHEYEQDLGQIRVALESLRSSVDGFNSGIPGLVRALVTNRREKLLEDAGMVASIGLPIKRREGPPMTYAVPVTRKQIAIRRHQSSVPSFRPEPTLDTDTYEQILDLIRSMVRVMELSPRAFEAMGEEDLRHQLLVPLNAQFEGQATGETFNFEGKTDILIRADGKNVFVAECKFWKGRKEFLKAIDQLLSYLSWRDSKAGLIMFNRNRDFSRVLAEIHEALPEHAQFKREHKLADESSVRATLRQPNDADREVLLTVMAFDVPSMPR